ncbi:MFS transporter [soil metagenome]
MPLRCIYPYIVCIITGLFIFYKYLLQVSPSVMTNDLMRDFQLTGVGLGNLTACFLYFYLLMQIPAGILFDKYNSRSIIVIALSICAGFTFVFAYAPSNLIACIARAGMGIGAAFAFIAYMKMITLWIPPKHFALMSGLGLTIAMLGAMGGQVPIATLVADLGWRQTLGWMGILGFLLALLCFLIIKNKHVLIPQPSLKSHNLSPYNFKIIINNKQNWLLGFFCGCGFAPMSVFGGLWGVPFLEQACNLSQMIASKNISLIFIGFAIGCPFFGWISDYLAKRKLVMAMGVLTALVCLSSIIYFSHFLPLFTIEILLFTFGFTASAVLLCFTIAVEIQSTLLAGSLIAFINTLSSLFEALTGPVIGKVLDLSWDGKLLNGACIFSVKNYHVGLLVLPIYLVVALLLLVFIEEPKSRG